MEESQNQRQSSNSASAAAKSYRRTTRRRSRSRVSFQSRRLLYLSLAFMLVVFALAGISALVYTRDNHVIVDGVTVSGINVGKLTLEQADKKLNDEVRRLKGQTLELTTDQFSEEMTLEDLGLLLSADSALDEAYNIGRNGSIFKQVVSKYQASNGVSLSLTQSWNDQKLSDTLKQKLAPLNIPCTEASFEITPQNTMAIKKEQVGRTIDTEDLTAQIKSINIFKPIPELTLKSKEEQPTLTAAQLETQKITGLLSSYTTRFDPTQTARSENVRLAAKALDKAIIKPGDTLSFNQIVGERTAEAGYKDAYIIVDGKFVPGLAGGICQVSSTLYNTGLLANLPVIQRSNHDLAISYVPLGQDATVAFPTLDLKFNNNTGAYLLIRTKVSNNSVTIELYGKVIPGQEVSITNKIESVIPAEEQQLVDETLGHGETLVKQGGQPGYLVNSVRTVKMNGAVVKTEPLQQSKYAPLPRVVAIGS